MMSEEPDVAPAQVDQSSTEVVAAPAPKKVKKVIRKKRPARPQVDSTFDTSQPPVQTGTIYNIWFNKWSGGDREDKYLSKTAAKGRCIIARDSGYTRADAVAGSYFCLFFARGVCPKGCDCEYLHRLPGIHDLYNPNVDCFGRDRFSDNRDDMGGVGSFLRRNTTIYVGRIHVTDDIEEIVARHFSEWGQVERIRVLNTRGVAFITYTNEANASFAKEAMAHQALDHNEILNVRWATADPNPMAQAREARRIEEQAAEAIRRALPEEFIAEIEGRDPEARKRRKIESGFGLEGYEAPDDVWFARGAQAVNPVGRRGYELEQEQRLMIDNGVVGGDETTDALGKVDGRGQQEPAENGGIFSSTTLAALKTAKVSTVPKTKPAVSSAPLVAYGSDSEGEEE